MLGFQFLSDCDMAAQVKNIKKKLTSRIWILRHLSHKGFSESDLLKVYKSVILPVHDYCSCVYNASLTLLQSSVLERLQAQALKAIYGYQFSYKQLLEKTGLNSLQARRDVRSMKFAQKCANNPRFEGWFQKNPAIRNTRNRLEYLELHARTKRLNNSPLYFMRRQLNAGQS